MCINIIDNDNILYFDIINTNETNDDVTSVRQKQFEIIEILNKKLTL